MASEDDTAYKQLFAHPEMVRDLLLGFVSGEWVRQLDLTSFERVNGSYVSDGGVQRHSDMVWRARLAGEWIYIYLLLEFQSRSDHWMALRMQVYIGLLYQDLIKRHELPRPGRLPPVFPVVLYNGDKPWTASRTLIDLVVSVPDDLLLLQASQRYLLIDQTRLELSAIASINNFAAAAFRVVRLETETEIVDESTAWCQLPEFAVSTPVWSGLSRWSARRLQRLTRERKIKIANVAEEGHAMSVPVIKNFADAWRYEAALYEHRERLRKLLAKRFGKIPARLNGRIEYAEMDDLDLWFDRIFDAKNIKEIFVENQPA
ncbi:Rpn family recombination-promoting nuclease/putative transposase [Duganella violaceipulchra]|uniref:Rpn family recombination-promoting nuclease/putative transposase n=1 Tax=Duganella violaceipulchra TaxID=2849652 RepID=A0AA41L2S7_9BURK|nr:Rpn family recombination-promoting nuclease/putative transposase [Duganella violaceicalia]MBV6322933.1 Rpn family recombination-promoting nuclease/putative transposase [Duganella violaceicalia]MCP2008015.1 hypothetical protein [Duganella violaceicalia]